ncbi:MAG TPA: hypothetical protein VH499_06635 [Reyranella sp.]|jgi:hypothetical protein
MYAHKIEMAERLVQSATDALARADRDLLRDVERAPTALYATDASGTLTWFNLACIGLAGRTPAAGRDRWCVTWKLYTEDGRFLPHDECPMAVAIKERRTVRGLAAIAERPDGTRTAFLACPTPILDTSRVFLGAVNALVELTFLELASFYGGQALRCRRLGKAVNDSFAIDAMARLAEEFAAKARQYRVLGDRSAAL